MKLPQFFLSGSGEKTATVSDIVFGGEINLVLLAQAVNAYRANQRRAHAHTQTRAEVERVKSKVYAQKGTGRARHGARTPNIFVGGGVSHGPRGFENYSHNMPQRMRLAALEAAFASQVSEKTVFVGQGAEKLVGNTKELKSTFSEFIKKPHDEVLVVIGQGNANLLRAAQNLEQVQLTRASRVHALEIANADAIIILAEALPELEARFAKKISKKVKPEAKAEAVAVTSKLEKAEKPAKKVAAKTTKTAVKAAPKKTAAKKTVKKAAK